MAWRFCLVGTRAFWLGLSLLVISCGDDDVMDADTGQTERDAGGVEQCGNARECSDMVFCNGAEQCDPDHPDADERGCVEAEPRCPGMCDERNDLCNTECVDADGDGHSAMVCGGDDCDDEDPDRYPSNTEVCDSEGVDEDCNPETIGDDSDGDGFIDDECCNLIDGTMECGTDCDDSSSDINPEATDICGNGDQDCDGDVDEDPNELVYFDGDQDGYGLDTMTMMACGAVGDYARLGGDCNDANGDVNPGQVEICDAMNVDEDCNGTANDGCDCSLGHTRPCGTNNTAPCRFGTQTCIADDMGRSVWGTCLDAIEPSTEVCNAVDDDCDGTVDNGPSFQCIRGTVEMGANACSRTGSRMCVADGPASATICRWLPPDFTTAETSDTCDYCDDSGNGIASETGFATAMDNVDLPTVSHFVTDGTTTNTGRFSDPLVIGYEAVVLDAKIFLDEPSAGLVSHGWALVVAQEDLTAPGSLLGTGGDQLGVPLDRNGFSVEWRWDDGVMNSNCDTDLVDDDTLVLRHLQESGADNLVGSSANPHPAAYSCSVHGSLTRREQHMRATITPDLPGGANTTEVLVEYERLSTWTTAFSCGGGAAACPFSIQSGQRYHFGMVSSVENTSPTHTRSWVATVTGSFARDGLCP